MATLTRLASARTVLTFAFLLAAAVSAAWSASSVRAADEAIYAPGEPIVTGFSGVVPPEAPPAGSDPLDYTFIDPAGHSMVIQQLQPDGPPAGQLIPASPVSYTHLTLPTNREV